MREAAPARAGLPYEIVDLIDEPGVDLGAVLDRLQDEGFAASQRDPPVQAARARPRPRAQRRGRPDRLGQPGAAAVAARRPQHRLRRASGTGLEAFLGDRPRGSVLQVGAGGAGLATACALVDVGFNEVVVHDRSEQAAARLVDRFGCPPPGLRLLTRRATSHAGSGRVGGVVHVTPTGMREHPGVALDVAALRRRRVGRRGGLPAAGDRARPTARARGLATLDGGADGGRPGRGEPAAHHRPRTRRRRACTNTSTSSSRPPPPDAAPDPAEGPCAPSTSSTDPT